MAFAPTSAYDAEAAKACLDNERAKATSCDGSFTLSSSCDKVFEGSGTKQPGEACEVQADCAAPETGRAWCLSPLLDGTTENQCRVELPGKEGSSPCLGDREGNVTSFFGDVEELTGYICDRADSLACNEVSGACERLSEAGGPCARSEQCVSSAFCEHNEGVCEERHALGEPCITEAQCERSAFCDADVCAPRLPNDVACEYDAQCQSDDCTGSACVSASTFQLDLLCGGG